MVERSVREHRDQDAEPAVRDAAQRAPVRVAAGAERGIVVLRGRVHLRTHPGEVITRVAQAHVTRVAHRDHAAFILAGLAPHGRDAGDGAEAVVIARTQQRHGVGNEARRHHEADARQRLENRDIAGG